MEIKKGDIVEVMYYSYWEPECSAIFEVQPTLELKYINGEIFENPYTTTSTIIGNSYDNPELLKGE